MLVAAAVAGDAVNFAVGAWFGARKRKGRTKRWPNPEHLRLTEEFFARHGGKTIILARFVPIVRTLAPFVAGVGGMRYRRFAVYNVTGAALWVVSVTLAGYQFGNIAWVRQNLSYVLVGIVVISVLPGVYQWIRKRRTAAH